jgi:hypothetical protein
MKFEYLKPEKWRFFPSDLKELREKLGRPKKPLKKNLIIDNG